MGHNRPLDRSIRIDVKISTWAVEPRLGYGYQLTHSHVLHDLRNTLDPNLGPKQLTGDTASHIVT